MYNVRSSSEAKALFEKFKTVSAIKKATTEELCEIRGISPALAEKLKEYFSQN